MGKVPITSEEYVPPRARVVLLAKHPDGWFLYRYSSDGAFAGDTWHQSREDALDQATFEFGVALSTWAGVPDDVDPFDHVRDMARSAPAD
jgi:hypothetical protein